MRSKAIIFSLLFSILSIPALSAEKQTNEVFTRYENYLLSGPQCSTLQDQTTSEKIIYSTKYIGGTLGGIMECGMGTALTLACIQGTVTGTPVTLGGIALAGIPLTFLSLTAALDGAGRIIPALVASLSINEKAMAQFQKDRSKVSPFYLCHSGYFGIDDFFFFASTFLEEPHSPLLEGLLQKLESNDLSMSKEDIREDLYHYAMNSREEFNKLIEAGLEKSMLKEKYPNIYKTVRKTFTDFSLSYDRLEK